MCATPNKLGPPTSDLEFVLELQASVQQYLSAVEFWETSYRKYYRLVHPGTAVSPDLADAQRLYLEAYKRLSPLLPRARGLSFKFGLRDPWAGLLKTKLGEYAPQARTDSAIGRSERIAITDCLTRLLVACRESEHSQKPVAKGERPFPTTERRRGLLRRIVDFFW